MTKSQRLIFILLMVIACALASVVSWYGYELYQLRWRAPLGPAISMPTSTWVLPATWTATLPGFVATPNLTPQVPSSATPIPALRCEGPQIMLVLGIGTDSRSNSYNYGLADVIRIIRLDFINEKVSVLALPRDLWVEIPDIADNINGQDHEKLNQAYLYGNPGFGYYDGPGAGAGLLARTLALNFGLNPERYVAVNMRTFEKIVDAVDGVEIYLPDGLDGRTKEDRSERLVFPKGTQVLDGEQALTLARIRNEGVFERTDTQNLILCSLHEKLTSPDVIVRIPKLINSFQGSVQTDLSPEQISQIACLGTHLQPEDISFVSFPQKLFKTARIYDPVFGSNVFIWDIDFSIMRDYVTRFILGAWPAPELAFEQQPETTFTCP
jgi:LCP family protein required for cell wall assembly